MNKPLVFSVVGLFAGILLGYGVAMNLGIEETVLVPAVNHSGMMMSMNDMATALQNKSGDEFDRAFIELMIPHHQGAIEMAEQAKFKAKHQEIKGLADAIVKAQNDEIAQMMQWSKEWGY